MQGWHLEMAAELERAGKFDQARLHLMRANLLQPAATSPIQ
jgi:Flp pilus assembly protein TadD